jgi:coenzyme F420-reducing hydrogenase delta subunit
MADLLRPVVGTLRAALVRADAALNRLYGSRFNPFYHSGALVVMLLVVLIATGLYLLLFYRVGAPYESTARITEQVWLGRWIRGLHRFASDAALVAVAVHALRMFVQRRSWGPRVLAWITGVVLVGVFLVCGWTGYVMVWDVQGQVLAVEGARLLDPLPILSEPLSRTFTGARPLPSAFFFTNLFLHVALPIGMGIVLWLHVSRVARPVLMPPRRLTWGVVGLLFGVSVVWPVTMAPAADLFRVPGPAEYDWFFSFWLPAARVLPTAAIWGVGLAGVAALVLVPWWTRPRPESRPAPSVVDERFCTGCEQCMHDCPYQAITMVSRSDGRPTAVALVDPALCVSCGICAASCAPMGVGPPGRTGRDQLADIRDFVARHRPRADQVVLIACAHGAGGAAAHASVDGAPVLPVRCAGSLHTSVIEYLVRSGAGGVLVASCPLRDCWNRDGVRWTEERMFHDREAELQARVDRRRVRMVEASAAEPEVVRRALRDFAASLPEAEAAEEDIDLLALCDRPQEVER